MSNAGASHSKKAKRETQSRRIARQVKALAARNGLVTK
jgi:hypothetical protein